MTTALHPQQLIVRIEFHGPFRVGTGQSRLGVAAVDDDTPLPSASVKGLMRASARRLLPGADAVVDAVFGAPRRTSPWYWSDAVFPEDGVRTKPRARIAIDSDSGTTRENHLFVADEHWAREAEFTVTRAAPLSPEETGEHLAVLACAAAGVHSLGGDRRRGLGWVTCTPVSPRVDDALLDRFESLRARSTDTRQNLPTARQEAPRG
ncbi:RAMP superfamily CRISPR-associated protein [Streptomyces sp. NPDC012403]|uniref:RAMP superfamily CRISPR-associated protein n=1 Tax=Streptomyces sp. NPDC012403 TaxID=3364831 RepID=UPI0036ED76B4